MTETLVEVWVVRTQRHKEWAWGEHASCVQEVGQLGWRGRQRSRGKNGRYKIKPTGPPSRVDAGQADEYELKSEPVRGKGYFLHTKSPCPAVP